MYTSRMPGIEYRYFCADAEGSHTYLLPCVENFLVGAPAGTRVLDIGCGNGSFLSHFRTRGWSLYGTDFSPSGIAIAQQSFPEIGFFLADASASVDTILDRVGPVDVILSTEVVEHLYDPIGMLSNAYAVLKPGGILIVSTPYHGYLKNLFLALTGKMDQHFTVLWEHGHIKFWSKKTLTRALKKTGFLDIAFEGAGRLPWLWKSMVLRARKPD